MSPKRGRVRIIAGKWRSRFIPVPDEVELRPTTDRIRETLFNWIAPRLEGARCLDVCSGSGVLAFEALSRGAAHVTAIDYDQKVVQHLQKQAAVFETTEIEIVYDDVLRWLSHPASQTFDIIFIDPPFAGDLWEPICQLLSERGWLSPDALIYVEAPIEKSLVIPESWQALKQKQTSHVKYELLSNS